MGGCVSLETYGLGAPEIIEYCPVKGDNFSFTYQKKVTGACSIAELLKDGPECAKTYQHAISADGGRDFDSVVAKLLAEVIHGGKKRGCDKFTVRSRGMCPGDGFNYFRCGTVLEHNVCLFSREPEEENSGSEKMSAAPDAEKISGDIAARVAAENAAKESNQRRGATGGGGKSNAAQPPARQSGMRNLRTPTGIFRER